MKQKKEGGTMTKKEEEEKQNKRKNTSWKKQHQRGVTRKTETTVSVIQEKSGSAQTFAFR